jgi:predicted lipoprotein with Yx(FWY)xxD motif
MATTTLQRLRSIPRPVRIAGPLVALALGAAACGSSSSNTNAASNSPASAATSSGGGAATQTVTLQEHSGASGTFLTDGAGRSVYLWEADKGMASTCNGACATAWPPLTITGSPTAGTGVTATNISTITRSDGKKQVTYDGHPLYFFAGDSGAGATNGEGSNGFGAAWWLVSPAGQAVMSTSGGTPSSSSSSSSGSSSLGY